MTPQETGNTSAELEASFELRGVTKSFGGVKALRGVDLVIRAGTVIGLAGENGAGKSTLLNILSGIHAPDGGQILFDGVAQSAITPDRARRAGIGRVAQELSLFAHLSVVENIVIGQEPRRGPFVDRNRARSMAEHALSQIGSTIPLDTMVRDLSFADRQLIEIAKALVSEPRVLILDEPTSGLRESEVDRLLSAVRELKAAGRSIVFITHRLSEMFAVCDTFTILKDGESVATRAASDITPDELVRLMVGRELSALFPPKPDRTTGEREKPLLNISRLSVPGSLVRDVDLTVSPGEIVGLAGLAGNGQNELLEGIAGVRRARGELAVGERHGPFSHPSRALRAGVSFVPEDRKTQGLVLEFSIRQNLTLSTLRKVSRWGFISRAREETVAQKSVKELAIRPADPALEVAGLSGGNQQKVVIGKTLQADPSIYIFSDPTRGIDIKTKQEIYLLMRRLASTRRGVLLLSTDLTEILGVCDRVLVMSQGRIVATFAGDQLTEENITRASFTGGTE